MTKPTSLIEKPATTKTTDKEQGFTLIELMIVVVIIGVLAAIAIPIFMNQQRTATLAALKTDVKNVTTMAATFKTKDGLYPKNCAEWEQAVPTGWTSNTTTLFRVKTSANGLGIWIEAQPSTVQGSDPTAVRQENTIVYNSNQGTGLMTRGEFETKFGYPSGTSLSVAEGYTGSGFRLDGTAGCRSW